MSRPRQSVSDGVVAFAASYRERHGLAAGAEFFIPFWMRLPDAVDVSAYVRRPDIAGWRFTSDDRLEPVPR
jgi:hypothetical protein